MGATVSFLLVPNLEGRCGALSRLAERGEAKRR